VQFIPGEGQAAHVMASGSMAATVNVRRRVMADAGDLVKGHGSPWGEGIEGMIRSMII
jgi:hypothetical protein